MIIAIASGKGGTGKTTVAVNLALVLAGETELKFLDCDVEEPNAHLFLRPELKDSEPVSIPVPRVDLERCNYCGTCAEVCAFNAIMVGKETVLVFEELCHGCGGCAYFCPEKAIEEVDRPIGVLESGVAGEIAFVHGRLNPGEALSPPLIKAVKEKADPEILTIVDAAPGASCPVVEAIQGSDYCLLVTEPTPFGLNDLAIAVELLQKLNLPGGVVINRTFGDESEKKIESYCSQNGVPILLKMPWDKELASLYARGEPVVTHLPAWRDIFVDLGRRILEDERRVRK
ncbi:MAG: P-loop NTPase [Firmicutes bacterium]|jgi:MinD superfamily P-loop ATPase|nr:P-loop NTPase [Bacillota bacterium]